jgi:hypothetical protein
MILLAVLLQLTSVDAASSVEVGQIGGAGTSSVVVSQAPAAPRMPPPQLAAPTRDVSTPAPAPADTRAAPQLNQQQRTASAPAGPGVAGDRKATVEVVKGSDACAKDDKAADALCKNAIETRSAEFAPEPPPQISVEASLLASMKGAPNPSSANGVARRLGAGEVNSDTAGALAYEQTRPETPKDGTSPNKQELPATTQDAVNAALQFLLGAGVQAR